MAGTDELSCSGCGARLAYEPGTDTLTCPFCGAENELDHAPADPWGAAIGEEPVAELDLGEAIAALGRTGDAAFEETLTRTCPGCGAEVSLGEGVLADACPFCAAPLAKAPTHTHRHPRPQGVLPFALTEAEAKARMRAWLGGLWFAPSQLKRYAEADRPLAGVYVPHYTYDAAAEARYAGQRGIAHTTTRMVSVIDGGKRRSVPRQVTRIRWHPVSGVVRRRFDDVLVPASDTLGELADAADARGASWDLAGLRPYAERYLAGFRAEAPSLELGAGFERASRAMEAALRDDARADIGGDRQRLTALTARFEEATFKHVLLPVWLAAYRFRNRPYRVIVNGRTGRVTGERPYSRTKIALAALLALLLVAALALLTARG